MGWVGRIQEAADTIRAAIYTGGTTALRVGARGYIQSASGGESSDKGNQRRAMKNLESMQSRLAEVAAAKEKTRAFSRRLFWMSFRIAVVSLVIGFILGCCTGVAIVVIAVPMF